MANRKCAVVRDASLSESNVEAIAFDLLGSLGWEVLHGPDIGPETPTAKRADYDEEHHRRHVHPRPFEAEHLGAAHPGVEPETEDVARHGDDLHLDTAPVDFSIVRPGESLIDGEAGAPPAAT